MDAIILVGGLGTRLRSVVSDKPKPLAPIRGRPFLDHLLKQIEGKVSKVILAAGFLSEQITEQYGDRCLISTEDSPLGTGGAARKAAELTDSEDIWVLNGDSFFDISFEEMEGHHSGDMVMACRYVEDVSRYGAVEIHGNRIVAFQEKKDSSGGGWINGGIYLIKKKLLLSSPVERSFSLEKELFPSLLLSEKMVMAYPHDGEFIDIGTPESYNLANEILA